MDTSSCFYILGTGCRFGNSDSGGPFWMTLMADLSFWTLMADFGFWTAVANLAFWTQIADFGFWTQVAG